MRPPLLCIWPPSRPVRWIFDRTAPGLWGSIALRTACTWPETRVGRWMEDRTAFEAVFPGVRNSDTPVKETNVIFRHNLAHVISTFFGTVKSFLCGTQKQCSLKQRSLFPCLFSASSGPQFILCIRSFDHRAGGLLPCGR